MTYVIILFVGIWFRLQTAIKSRKTVRHLDTQQTISRLQIVSAYTFEVRLNGESGVVAKSIDEPTEPPDVKLSSFSILTRNSFNYCHVVTLQCCHTAADLTCHCSGECCQRSYSQTLHQLTSYYASETRVSLRRSLVL